MPEVMGIQQGEVALAREKAEGIRENSLMLGAKT
jgi:hypothetical protein